MDSCDKNLINTSGSSTIGDYLCRQVKRWLRSSASFKSDGVKNLQLPFYYRNSHSQKIWRKMK